MHLCSRKKKTASLLMGCGFLLLLLFSLQGPSTILLRPLENIYPAAFPDIQTTRNLPHIQWIVVLGGGTVPEVQRPANSKLNGGSLARIIEGIRLANLFPKAHLVLTGAGSPGDLNSTAGLMAQTAVAMGITPTRITTLDQAMDTPDEAHLTAGLIPHKDTLILVTSASHLHRAMRLFQKQGLTPIPAPAYFLTKTTTRHSIMEYIPSADNLKRSERAIYEYLGLLWSSWRHLI